MEDFDPEAEAAATAAESLEEEEEVRVALLVGRNVDFGKQHTN